MTGSNEFKLNQPPEDGISSVKFSPNTSQFLLVSSWDTSVRLYDVPANSLRLKYQHTGAVLDCAFYVGGPAPPAPVRPAARGRSWRVSAWPWRGPAHACMGIGLLLVGGGVFAGVRDICTLLVPGPPATAVCSHATEFGKG